jgi:hypothetical protein
MMHALQDIETFTTRHNCSARRQLPQPHQCQKFFQGIIALLQTEIGAISLANAHPKLQRAGAGAEHE